MAQNNNEEKKNKFSVRKLIYNDKYLIIFSIIAAVIVWVVASMNLSPETTKTITVPVNVDFSDSAASHLGLKCYGDESFEVDVTVSCKKYLAKDITADSINVILQTNTVTTKGNFEVPLKVEAAGENADFNVESYYPTVYKAYFDVEDQKTMDITLNYENKDFISDGYIMGEPLLSENTAVVTGPKSYVSQVKQLIANVDIEKDIKSTQSVDLNVLAVDSNGSTVDLVSVNTGSENLTLTIPVLKQTTLNVATSFVNVPKGVDVSAFAVSYSKDTVTAGVLEDAGIKEANIGNIDFSQLKPGTNEIKFDVSNFESMVILDDINKITATVNVPESYKQKKVNINASSVTVANVPDGYTATVNYVDSSFATIIGAKSDIEAEGLGAGLIVDLSAYKNNITTGSADYDITTSVENSEKCWVYGQYKANITITKN